MRKISNGLVCENGNQPGFFLRSRWCRCRCGCLTSLLLKLTSDAEANQKKNCKVLPNEVEHMTC